MNVDQARGLLLGLACGDALGRPVEFKSVEWIAAEHGTLTEMVGQGTWNQPAGTITDDTEQALCIARSLKEHGRFDPEDIASRFVDWYETGPFDIGRMTQKALRRLQQGESWEEAGRNVWADSPEGQNAGNGSIMRCPPLSISFTEDFDTLERFSRQSSLITHADPRCTNGCAILNLTLAGILNGSSTPLRDALNHVEGQAPQELENAVAAVLDRDDSLELQSSGYVIHTLQTALHDGLMAESVEDAIVRSVNRGGDTDTVGAVTGAIAGARFGASELPERWIEAIDETAEIETLSERLVGVD